MKKIIAIALCLILCVGLLPMAAMADEAQITVHAKAPSSWSGINIWAWIDGATDTNVFPSWPGQAMTLSGNWYTMNVPAGVTGIVLSTGSGSPQSVDLPIEPGKDVWIIVGEAQESGKNIASIAYSEADAKEPSGTGTPAPTPTPTPSNGTYHVVGSGSIFSSEWTPTDDHLMTKNADGTYTKTYTNVAAGTLGLKVMQDGTIWIPDGMGNEQIVEVPSDGSTVVMTYNPATATLTVKVTAGSGGNTPAPAPTNDTYQVVGSGSIFGTDWEISDDHLMTKNADGTYSKTYTNVAAGTLGLKVLKNGSEWIPDGMGNETIVEVATGGSTVVVTFDPATSAIAAQITEGGGEAPTGPNAENITVYAYVPGNWESPCLWAWSDGVGDAFTNGWPGEAMTLDGQWYKATAPGWVTGVIINAGGGTVQTADLIVEAGKDVWVVVDATGTANFYYEEPTDLSGGEKPTEPTVPQPTEPSQPEEPKSGISGPVAALISFAVVVIIGVGVLMILRSKKLAAQKEEPAAEEAAEEEATPQE